MNDEYSTIIETEEVMDNNIISVKNQKTVNVPNAKNNKNFIGSKTSPSPKNERTKNIDKANKMFVEAMSGKSNSQESVKIEKKTKRISSTKKKTIDYNEINNNSSENEVEFKDSSKSRKHKTASVRRKERKQTSLTSIYDMKGVNVGEQKPIKKKENSDFSSTHSTSETSSHKSNISKNGSHNNKKKGDEDEDDNYSQIKIHPKKDNLIRRDLARKNYGKPKLSSHKSSSSSSKHSGHSNHKRDYDESLFEESVRDEKIHRKPTKHKEVSLEYRHEDKNVLSLRVFPEEPLYEGPEVYYASRKKSKNGKKVDLKSCLRFFEAAKMGEIGELEKMIEREPSLLSQKDDKEWSALEYAISECQLDCCFFLIESGCTLNPKKRKTRNLPLQVAVRCNFNTLAPLKLLFSLGCDVNLADNSGQTALWEAVRLGNFPAVKWLIDHGAQINFVAEETGSKLTLLERSLVSKEAQAKKISEFIKRKIYSIEEEEEDIRQFYYIK